MAKTYDFQMGEMLLIDKPLEWTSFDVVNKLRYEMKKSLDIKKIKLGHAGTLDPLATGLLILMSGKKTKEIEGIQGQQKEYIGEIQLGASTPSYDRETEVDQTYVTDHISESLILDTISKNFLGRIEQVPPMFSALKHKGVRLYKLARAGETVALKKRTVTIDLFELQSYKDNCISFKIQCSKGTYIRSIAHDIGIALGSGGYLKSLRRTKIGAYSIDQAKSVEEMIMLIRSQSVHNN